MPRFLVCTSKLLFVLPKRHAIRNELTAVTVHQDKIVCDTDSFVIHPGVANFFPNDASNEILFTEYFTAHTLEVLDLMVINADEDHAILAKRFLAR